MDCARVEAFLPWHLNRTLVGDEAEAVESHLAECATCRRAFAETRWMAGIADPHLAPDLLADLAAGAPLAVEDRTGAEAHLGVCGECAAELVLVRESWVGTVAPSTAPRGSPGARLPRPRFGRRGIAGIGGWRAVAAAALVAGLALSLHGGWRCIARWIFSPR